MLETVVLVIAGLVNLILGGIAFLLWQAIQSVKETISAESEARQATERRLAAEIEKVEKQVTTNEHHVTETFLRKEDYLEFSREMKSMLQRILDKLDGTLSVLESIRERFGPVYVTSGCRCSDYNAQVGGAPDSQHVHARAADIQVEGASPDAVYNYVVNNLSGVSAGRYDTFTHIDTRTDGPARWDARSSSA